MTAASGSGASSRRYAQAGVRGQRPTALNWTPKTSYDLSDDVDLRMLYETVIREAAPRGSECLNVPLLARVWPRLWLPRRVRMAWESRFPDPVRAAA